MAGGNLSPRQKMINMMYLVLTALLALNVSREVMDAFYEVMIGQEASIETIEDQNASLYAAFKRAADENEVKAGTRGRSPDMMWTGNFMYKILLCCVNITTNCTHPSVPGTIPVEPTVGHVAATQGLSHTSPVLAGVPL